jgi:hypothetical protein
MQAALDSGMSRSKAEQNITPPAQIPDTLYEIRPPTP